MMSYSHCFILYVIGVIWIGTHSGVEGASCNAGDKLGVADTAPAPATSGTNSGTSYLLTGTNMFVPCCGVITRWNFGAKNTGDLTAQVWRQVAGSTYEVVGENVASSVAANTELHMDIGASNQISVQPNDLIGWHSSGVDIVGYINDGGANQGVSTSTGKTADGASLAWSVAVSNTERWLAEVEFGPGTAPTFGTSLPTTVNAAVSNTVGSKIHDITPTDVNTDEIPDLTVSITPTSALFELDGTEVKVKATLTPGTHYVVFEVVDPCQLTGTATLTVIVADTAPVITSLSDSVPLREDRKTEENLHTLVFSDDDTPLTDVICRIDSTDPTPAPLTLRMVGTSYEVSFIPDTGNSLDYTTKPLYDVNVICNDGTSDSDSALLQVTIIPNEPPVPTITSPLVVDASDTPANKIVGTVTATDPEGDAVTFTMSDCASCPFMMTSDGNIYSTINLNDHRTGFYTVNVTVRDDYNTVGPTEMVFQIINLNTPPTITNPTKVLPEVDSVSVKEHTLEGNPNPIGTTVSVFTATGTDNEEAPTDLTWEMNFKNGKGSEYFEFNPATGEITTKQDINFEDLSTQNIVDTIVEIRAFDGREYSEWREMKITVEDVNETPVFDADTYAIETTEAAGELDCPYFDVTDPDKYDTQSYTLDCGAVSVFQVDTQSPACGALLVQTAEYDLDNPGAEKEVVTCTVTITDKLGLTATATLSITVHEEDDNEPRFDPTSYAYTIQDTIAVGSVFGDTDALDDDFLAKHRRLHYTTDSSDFGVDANGGIFSKTDWSTQSVPTTRKFMVTTTDEAGHSDTAEVAVNIVETPTTTTTTTQATTLPQTYQEIKSFLDDPGNLGWLIPAILLGLAGLGLSIFMCFRCCTPGACVNMCKGGSLFRGTGRTGRGRIAGRTVMRSREPVRTVRRTLVREKEPVRIVEREPVRTVEREPEIVKKSPKEPKNDSSIFDCFKSKPKDKPPPAKESWDFWNSGGF